MQSEIEKVIAEIRGFGASRNMMEVQHAITSNAIADRLQAILDADPVARLEAMGAHLECYYGDVRWAFDEDAEYVGDSITAQTIADAATRLLARILEAYAE